MNPKWKEALGRVESGTAGNKSIPEVRTGFEPGATACKHNALSTGPRPLCEFPFRKRSLPFLTVDAILSDRAFRHKLDLKWLKLQLNYGFKSQNPF